MQLRTKETNLYILIQQHLYVYTYSVLNYNAVVHTTINGFLHHSTASTASPFRITKAPSRSHMKKSTRLYIYAAEL